MKSYRLKAPFVLHDGTVVPAGEILELEDDVARAHAEKVDPIPEAPEQPVGATG